MNMSDVLVYISAIAHNLWQIYLIERQKRKHIIGQNIGKFSSKHTRLCLQANDINSGLFSVYVNRNATSQTL